MNMFNILSYSFLLLMNVELAKNFNISEKVDNILQTVINETLSEINCTDFKEDMDECSEKGGG